MPLKNDLSRAEKLIIARRRAGLTLAAAARRHKTDVDTYRTWEQGGRGAPTPAVGRVAEHEICFILRLRRELTLADLAPKLGVCRYWLHRMENGSAPAAQLVKYWSSRG